uniref:Uncharacterized protein n=1 Tax=Parastrongyloides trichosuri TaxID=131310 RepID=A0A0N4Z2L9_PARTI
MDMTKKESQGGKFTPIIFNYKIHISLLFIFAIFTLQFNIPIEGKLNKWDNANALWGKRSSYGSMYSFDFQPDYLMDVGGYNNMVKRPSADWQKMNSLWGKRSSKWDNANALWGKRASWKSADGLWGKRASSWNNANGLWGR